MNKQQKEEYDMQLMGGVLKGCLSAVAFWVALLLLLLLFGSCKSVKYVPVIDHKTDTCYITKWQWDSIYVHDSIRIKEGGDTLLIEQWHTKYKEKQVHDTIYIATHDTIPYPYPVEVIKEVEKPLTWWQKLKMRLGIIAMVFIFGWICWHGAKIYMRRY